MGVCLASDSWYADEFRKLVDKCFIRCEAVDMQSIFDSSISFLQRTYCQIMYAKECVNITNATPEELKPAWHFYFNVKTAIYGEPDDDGVYSDTPVLSPADCSHLRLVPIVKIHKTPPALRPIVSGSIHPMLAISRAVSKFIWSLLNKIPHRIIRSMDDWISFHRSRPRHLSNFISADIVSFYTEISSDCAERAFQLLGKRFPVYFLTFQLLFRYFRWSTSTAVLTAGTSTVHQAQGCIMGFADAPAMSQLIRSAFELQFISPTLPHHSLTLFGYIDDIISYFSDRWPVEEVKRRISAYYTDADGHPLFDFEWDTNPSVFLSCRFIGVFDTQFNIKPTGLSLVPWLSLHPRRYLRGAVIGLFTFARRHASNDALFFSSLIEIMFYFRKAGFPLSRLLDWLPLVFIRNTNISVGWRADLSLLDKILFTSFHLEHLPNARNTIYYINPNYYCRLRGFNGRWDSSIEL